VARIPESDEPAKRKISLPKSVLRPTRVALLVVLTLVAALGPSEWLRACAVAIALIVFYGAGWSDGRRDALVELVTRGNPRAARSVARSGDQPQGE
jgi:hypothetical protein